MDGKEASKEVSTVAMSVFPVGTWESAQRLPRVKADAGYLQRQSNGSQGALWQIVVGVHQGLCGQSKWVGRQQFQLQNVLDFCVLLISVSRIPIL